MKTLLEIWLSIPLNHLWEEKKSKNGVGLYGPHFHPWCCSFFLASQYFKIMFLFFYILWYQCLVFSYSIANCNIEKSRNLVVLITNILAVYQWQITISYGYIGKIIETIYVYSTCFMTSKFDHNINKFFSIMNQLIVFK